MYFFRFSFSSNFSQNLTSIFFLQHSKSLLVYHFRLQHIIIFISFYNKLVSTLASAERSIQFEHRDLHWGNILIDRVKDKKKSLFVLVEGSEYEIVSCGLIVTIIDFTLARMLSGTSFKLSKTLNFVYSQLQLSLILTMCVCVSVWVFFFYFRTGFRF